MTRNKRLDYGGDLHFDVDPRIFKGFFLPLLDRSNCKNFVGSFTEVRSLPSLSSF